MGELQRQVQGLLDAAVAAGHENGAQAAVYRAGEPVAEAVAGVADHETREPVTPRTLFYTASTMKGVTATLVHVLAEQGVLDYDQRIADVWPEFGVHGKETATIRHVLTHSAGVPAVPQDLTWQRLCDWDEMAELIAGLEPWWRPGERVGYHAVTFGFILGEVVRRITGKPVSQVLTESIGRPLGIADELYYGVLATEVSRVARLEDDPAGAAMFASLPPEFPLFRAGPRSLIPNAELANRPRIIAADVPAWGFATARALARMYAALLGEVDGVRLISPERLREVTTLATDGIDELTGGPAQYGLGYTVGTIGQRPVPTTVFGMVGIGGSAAYADTATGLCVALTKNRFNPAEINTYEQLHMTTADHLP